MIFHLTPTGDTVRFRNSTGGHAVPTTGSINLRRVVMYAAVCGFVCASLGVAAVSPSTAQQADGQIASVNVTTDQPVTGESVLIETTVANLDSSDSSLDITDVSFERRQAKKPSFGLKRLAHLILAGRSQSRCR